MTPSTSDPANWTLSASLPDGGSGCAANQPIDGSATALQYGIDAMPGCSPNSVGGLTRRDEAIGAFGPFTFWFAAIPRSVPASSNGTVSTRASVNPAGGAVFCAPTIGVYSVEATADGSTGSLLAVKQGSPVDRNSNNVTSGDFAGQAFNGWVLHQSASPDMAILVVVSWCRSSKQ